MDPFEIVPVIVAANKDKLGSQSPMSKREKRITTWVVIGFVLSMVMGIALLVHSQNTSKYNRLQDWTGFSQRNHEVTIVDLSSRKVPSSDFSDYEHVITVKGVATGETRVIHDRTDPVFIYPTPETGQTWVTRVERKGDSYEFKFKMDLVKK